MLVGVYQNTSDMCKLRRGDAGSVAGGVLHPEAVVDKLGSLLSCAVTEKTPTLA